MNRNLIKILAFIGVATCLLGCAQTPVEASVTPSVVPSEETSVEIPKIYEAIVTFNGNTATIYDDFDSYEFGYYKSTIYIYYATPFKSTSGKFTILYSDTITLTNYALYSIYGLTKEDIYNFVSKQVGENGQIIYYDEEMNVLTRSK